MKVYSPFYLIVSGVLACTAIALGFATAGRTLATALIQPKIQGDANLALVRELGRRGLNAEELRAYLEVARRFPPELSPFLQIREREPAPEFAAAFLRGVQERFQGRRLLLILGASEAGHHACNTEHCVTMDLAAAAGPNWIVINLARHGQTLCETARFLDEIRPAFTEDRIALAITVNPVFFAGPGRRETPASGHPGALLEQELTRRFGTELLRRAVFGHLLGVSPVGQWQMNWMGPIGPALLPELNAGQLRRIKPRRPDFAYYSFPGTGPTPARDWRSYYTEGRIDLKFAAERVDGLNLNRGRACLVELKRTLDATGRVPVVVIHTALNPGLLGLLDEQLRPRESYAGLYEKFRGERDRASASLKLPAVAVDRLEPARDIDFVDLDHPSPAGHARLARLITESLPLR